MASNVSVCWLYGNLHERKLVLNKIKGQFAGCEIIKVGSEVSFSYFEKLVYSSPCFSDKRIIIVEGLPQPAGTKPTMIKHIKKMLDNVPDDLLIVFDGIDPKDEKQLSDHVKSVGKIFDFPVTIDRNAAPDFVVKLFEENGKSIESKEAKLLADTSGFDPAQKGISADILRLAVNKISTYLGRRKNVTEVDVISNVFPSEEFIIWTINDALDSRSLLNCHNCFHRMVQNADGDTIGAIHTLFAITAPRYRMLLFLKEGLSKGMTKPEVTASALTLLKLKPSGTNLNVVLQAENGEAGPKSQYNEYGIRTALNGMYGRPAAVEQYNRRDLVRIVNCVNDCMTELRFRTGEADLTLLVDALFLTVCTQMDDAKIERIRKSQYVA